MSINRADQKYFDIKISLAIENANISVDDIDAIVVGTVSSDYNFPGMAPIIQQKLGISKTP